MAEKKKKKKKKKTLLLELDSITTSKSSGNPKLLILDPKNMYTKMSNETIVIDL